MLGTTLWALIGAPLLPVTTTSTFTFVSSLSPPLVNFTVNVGGGLAVRWFEALLVRSTPLTVTESERVAVQAGRRRRACRRSPHVAPSCAAT